MNRITSETAIYGIMGNPLHHSLSPRLHNEVFQRHNINAVYLAFPVAAGGVAAAVAGLKALTISGINVTIPHKEAVIPHLDRVDETARAIGAVNTITRRDGQLVGSNTDWQGFADSLTHLGFDPAGRQIVLLGCGGSARAVIYALGKKNCKGIMIYNRTQEKAAAVAEHFSTLFPATRISVRPLADFSRAGGRQPMPIIIDTLPGPVSFTAPPAADQTGEATLYYPISYGAGARGKQCPADWQRVDGLAMLVFQACRSFSLWFGRRFSATQAAAFYGEMLADLQTANEPDPGGHPETAFFASRDIKER
ncbi:MAG: shikimate dehydrogenase [Deltaproteobacteria bacterium]|nr:shikimate dehydrogenase [Candidatus Anaeroferrophillus wilburensis]MBN2888782.1 shikimate dehydrogenase [Deltaproteobacteria bacterium]